MNSLGFEGGPKNRKLCLLVCSIHKVEEGQYSVERTATDQLIWSKELEDANLIMIRAGLSQGNSRVVL